MESFFQFNIGQLAVILSILSTGVGFIYALRGDILRLTDRLLALEVEIKKLSEVVVQLAKQDVRLLYVEKELIDLRKVVFDQKNEEISVRRKR